MSNGDEVRLTIELDREMRDKFRQRLALINFKLTMKDQVISWIKQYLNNPVK